MATGIATLDFGAAPGTNTATLAISAAPIASTSYIDGFIMGTDSTTDHTAYEHWFLAHYVHIAVTAISAGVSFTLTALTELRLSGQVKIRWVYV